MYGSESAHRNDVSETLVKIEQVVKEIRGMCDQIQKQHEEIRKLLSPSTSPAVEYRSGWEAHPREKL